MRYVIYTLVRKSDRTEHYGRLYDLFISAVAFLSIVPLMFKEQTRLFERIDMITVYILFLDYIFRWIANDYMTGKKGVRPFLTYPFTPFALIDLISILPSLGLLGHGFRILRMMRIFKVLHYSESFVYVSNVFKKEKKTLFSVLVIAMAYIFVSALAMFSYEPETFDSFFDALYWATTALTTVGYGDIYPKTQVGQFISMISSLFGIAVIALPAGIVTGGFVEEINKKKQEQQAALDREQAALDREKAELETQRQELEQAEAAVQQELIAVLECEELVGGEVSAREQ